MSGQSLVPVLVEGETVLHDSPVIMRWLDERFPARPLWRRTRRVARRWTSSSTGSTVSGSGHRTSSRPAGTSRSTARASPRRSISSSRSSRGATTSSATSVPPTSSRSRSSKYSVLWDEGDEQEFHRILQRLAADRRPPARRGVDPPRRASTRSRDHSSHVWGQTPAMSERGAFSNERRSQSQCATERVPSTHVDVDDSSQIRHLRHGCSGQVRGSDPGHVPADFATGSAPLKSGLRFSTNAVRPSVASSDARAR